MTAPPDRHRNKRNGSARRRGRVSLAVFWVLFVLFGLNILLGKATVQFGWDLPLLLGDVPEFLLLLAASVFLMLAALGRERDRDDAG